MSMCIPVDNDGDIYHEPFLCNPQFLTTSFHTDKLSYILYREGKFIDASIIMFELGG